ncbi:alpha-(1,6)-fucosyltransferase-like [Haemaphysalis longicornis]
MLVRLEESLASMRGFLVRHVVPPATFSKNSTSEEIWEFKPKKPIYANSGDLIKAYSSGKVDPRHTRLMVFRALEYLWVMEFDVAVIKETDPAVLKAAEKLQKASEFVRMTLQHLQNPVLCEKAHKLRCRVDNGGSMGAGLHDLLWCFVAGLQTGRTVVLDDAAWKHTTGLNQWSHAFLPLVEPACERAAADATVAEVALERRSIVDLPATLVHTLVVSHGDPYAWWFGHIMAYILRPSNVTAAAISEVKDRQGYKHPIVGVHVDGNGEWTLVMRNVADCMRIAEEFYAKRALLEVVKEKRVFIDTNRLAVVSLVRQKYPDYKVITSGPIVSTQVQNIVTMAVNVHLLAQSDRLVCAFSSAWCRVAYELMQGQRGSNGSDATREAFSVDVPYSYAGVPFPPRRARYPNNYAVLDRELSWGLDDLAWIQEDALPAEETPGVARRDDSFPEGRKLESSKTEESSKNDTRPGIYPRFKTIPVFSVAPYSLFSAAGQELS